jgi:hypothetical protein
MDNSQCIESFGLIGSSETKRGVSSLCGKYSHNFIDWFVGFSEGDGGFYFDNGRFYFKIRQLNPKVLNYIKETLRFGGVNLSADGY